MTEKMKMNDRPFTLGEIKTLTSVLAVTGYERGYKDGYRAGFDDGRLYRSGRKKMPRNIRVPRQKRGE